MFVICWGLKFSEGFVIFRDNIRLIMEEMIGVYCDRNQEGCGMSRKKKKEKSSPMPAASAGLLRFFEEETAGIKVRPELLVGLAISLIVVSALARIYFG